MKRTISTLLFFSVTMSLAACAAGGSDVDSESHFQCGSDADCQSDVGRTECVSGSCKFPGSARTRLIGEPGPVVDCTSEWPPMAVSFETENMDFGSRLFGPMDRLDAAGAAPRMNRNGTVIVGVTQPSNDLEDPGQLIRWTGDTVSRLEQSGEYTLIPQAVSCDGMTIVGVTHNILRSARSKARGYRWTASDGFSELPEPSGMPTGGDYSIAALSADGSTAFGTYNSLDPDVAVRWQGNAAEAVFTLDEWSMPFPGWSADGSVFIGFTGQGLFMQAPGTPPSNLDVPLEFNGGGTLNVSFDGKVLAGGFTDRTARTYVWSYEHQLEYLPAETLVVAVSPNGVAVGGSTTAISGDLDVVWDRIHGARHLREILAKHGVQVPAGTQIYGCGDISADGRVITGISYSRGEPSVFRAVLPAGAFD
jgi:hypothetical protein